MKDFFDIWFLAQTFAFEGKALNNAGQATFERRNTELSPGNLVMLLSELAGDASKRTQWRAFLRKSSLVVKNDFVAVIPAIHRFLVPLVAVDKQDLPGSMSWVPGGRWYVAGRPLSDLGSA